MIKLLVLGKLILASSYPLLATQHTNNCLRIDGKGKENNERYKFQGEHIVSEDTSPNHSD